MYVIDIRYQTSVNETRNDIFFLDAGGAPALADPTKVNFRFSGLPDGITTESDGGMYGGIGGQDKRASRIFVKINVGPQVKPGEYKYAIHLEYEGTEFGIITAEIKVIPPGSKITGAIYVPGSYLFVWGHFSYPIAEGTVVSSGLYNEYGLLSWWQNQTAAVNDGTWSVNVSLGTSSVPSVLDSGKYTLNVLIPYPSFVQIVGGVGFSVPAPSKIDTIRYK